MANTELHARLLEDARKYDPTAHNRSLLAPFKDVILVLRAKFMSYEQISATLKRNGLSVSGPAVGVFCRANFTKTDIERARREHLQAPPAKQPRAPLPDSTSKPGSGVRGPRIARDDY